MSRERKLRSLLEGEIHSVAIEPIPDGYRVGSTPPGTGMSLVRGPEVPVWSVLSDDGRSFEVMVERRESEIEVSTGQSRFRFQSASEPRSRPQTGRGSGRLEIKSPMPGKVVRVLVARGETVAAGQPILLFEAMKMQNELRTPQAGIVSQVQVQAGQAVEARELLYILDPI